MCSSDLFPSHDSALLIAFHHQHMPSVLKGQIQLYLVQDGIPSLPKRSVNRSGRIFIIITFSHFTRKSIFFAKVFRKSNPGKYICSDLLIQSYDTIMIKIKEGFKGERSIWSATQAAPCPYTSTTPCSVLRYLALLNTLFYHTI